MGAFTSKASGNWSASGQTTWNEVGVPGNGDTVTIGTGHNIAVDVDTIIGTSGAAGTVVVRVNTTGTLAIAAGKKLTVRGDLELNNTTLTLAAGAIYEFDSSLAAGTPIYKLIIGTASSQGSAKLVCNGTSGAHCQIKTATSSGVGVITASANSTNAWAQLHADYTDFLDMGNSTAGFGTDAFFLVANSSGQEIYFKNCTFARCGRLYAFVAADAHVRFTFNNWISVVGSYSTWIQNTAKTTGDRNYTDNVMEAGSPVWQGSRAGFVLDRSILNDGVLSGIGDTTTGLASAQNVLFYARSGTVPCGLAGVFDTWLNGYCFVDTGFGSGDIRGIEHYPSIAAGAPGTLVFDGMVYDSTVPSEDGDWCKVNGPSSGSVQTVRQIRGLVLPNSRGKMSGSILSLHGDTLVRTSVEHCTYMSADNAAPSTTGKSGYYQGSSFPGIAGLVAYCKNNLVWAKAALASFGTLIWQAPDARWAGTADAGGTTTKLIDANPSTGAAFQANALESLGEGAARLYVSSGGGGGPAAGESSTVTSNTTTDLTLSPALSAAPANGVTQYRCHVVDVATPSGLDYNGKFNLNTGTIYDQNGGNGAAKNGYDGFCLSAQAIGTNDVALSGADETTGGPKFIDSSRNMATFDRAYLGNTGVTAWVTSTVYAVGDIRSNSNAGFFGGVVINYRCVLAHTSGASTEPGAGATWRTNWELASVYRIKQAILNGTTITDAALGLSGANYIETLRTWVRAGFAPRESTLMAASDGGWMGAVTGAAGSSVNSMRPHRRRR